MRDRWPLIPVLICALLPAGLVEAGQKITPAPLANRSEARAVCGMVAARGLAIEPMLVENGVPEFK